MARIHLPIEHLKLRFSRLVFPSLLAGLLPLSSAQGPSGTVDVLRPEPSAAFWNMRRNGGSVLWENGVLVLRPSSDGATYPFLVSRQGTLRGDWTLSLSFRFLQISERGSGVALRNVSTGREVLRVHADKAQRGIQLWAGDASRSVSGTWNGSPSVALGGASNAEHVYTVARSGSLFTFRYDGRELARVQGEPGDYALRIGSDVVTYPGSWSTIALSSLSIRYAGEPPRLRQGR